MRFKNERLHKKNEAKELVFAINNSRVYFYGNEKDIFKVWREIFKKLKEIENNRRYNIYENIEYETPFLQGDGEKEGLPDIVYESDSWVIGIEHFEFDASGTNRKGSKMHLAEIEAEEKIYLKRLKNNQYPSFEEEVVDVEFSYNGYVESLIKGFKKHMKNIERYRKALEENYPDKKVYFAFYIEDVTAIGNYIDLKDGREPMCPLLVTEFLDVLKECEGIDYIITRTQNFYTHQLYICQIYDKSIKALYNKAYDIKRDIYVPYRYMRVSHVYRCDDK